MKRIAVLMLLLASCKATGEITPISPSPISTQSPPPTIQEVVDASPAVIHKLCVGYNELASLTSEDFAYKSTLKDFKKGYHPAADWPSAANVFAEAISRC